MVAFTLLQTLCGMTQVRFRAWESNAHQWTNRLCTHRINRIFGCTCEALQGASGYWAAAEWQHRLASPWCITVGKRRQADDLLGV